MIPQGRSPFDGDPFGSDEVRDEPLAVCIRDLTKPADREIAHCREHVGQPNPTSLEALTLAD
jgi:hypothetical protein